MTICKRCKHFDYHGFDCEHPSLRRKQGVDPVSGEKVYIHEDGTQTGCPFPRARRVNTDGNCPLYEKKFNLIEWLLNRGEEQFELTAKAESQQTVYRVL